MLLLTLQAQIMGFEVIKDLYEDEPDFGFLWKDCANGPKNQFFIQDGYFFRGNQLCIPLCSVREVIIREAHGEGLVEHFGRDKTLLMVQEHYF